MSNLIEEAKRNAIMKPKRNKKQKQYGLILLVVLILIGIFISFYSTQYGTYWFFGISLGFILQKSRFCFAAGFRDPVLVGSTSLLKAIIIASLISTIGFAYIQYQALGGYFEVDVQRIPGAIYPVGIHTILGAVIFGIGMVIAGACASGTLMRVGEGFIMQMIVMIGFMIGVLWGAKDYEIWNDLFISKSPTIYLPKIFGFWRGVVLQIIVLILLYLVADWYDKNNNIMDNL